jgi:hypothetical protein
LCLQREIQNSTSKEGLEKISPLPLSRSPVGKERDGVGRAQAGLWSAVDERWVYQ